MNLPDLIIIYLACGAPFGVYYFLQHRNRIEIKLLVLKSLIRFVFWIPYAVRLVVKKFSLTNLYNINFDSKTISDAKKEAEIEEIKKYFENVLRNIRFSRSIYEFREIFDRFVGLTLELESETGEAAKTESELFRITNHGNKKIGEVCLNRRNRQRLSFHQKLARRDFLQMVDEFLKKNHERQILFNISLRLADMLNDSEARTEIANLAQGEQQTVKKSRVSNSEQEIWKTAKHGPLTDKPISTNLQVLTATAKLSNKD